MIKAGVQLDEPHKRYIPNHPHKWRLDSYICQVCGISLQAIIEFPHMGECSPVATFPVHGRPTEEPLSAV